VVTGSGHQATVAQPVQQVIQTREGIQHTELLVDPLSQILGPAYAGLRVVRLLIQVGMELLLLGIVQAALIAAAATLGQSFQALGVVAVDPRLYDSPRDPHELGDLRGGLALLGQQDHLQPQYHLCPSLLADQTLQFLDAVMFDDMHGSPPCEIQHAIAIQRAQP
jgi:hypothetical protein